VKFSLTNPLSADTDGDGLDDFFEVNSPRYPAADGSMFPLSARNADSDGDGLNDRDELANQCSPRNPDTDGDGFSDLQEVTRGTRCNDPTSF